MKSYILPGRHRLAFLAVLVAVFISIALGIFPGRGPGPAPASFSWSEVLRALTSAPIAPGTRVVLVPPPGTSELDGRFWSFEARWRRPDLLWSLPNEWPLREGPTVGLSVGLMELPPGWHEVWRHGALRLARRENGR